MKRFHRALQLFLVYALLWPITMGDKIVRLDAPTAEYATCNTPWGFYKDLGRTLFGPSSSSTGASSMRRDTDVEPAQLPVTTSGRVQAAPCRVLMGPRGAAPRPRRVPPPQLFAPPPPPLALLVDSKE